MALVTSTFGLLTVKLVCESHQKLGNLPSKFGNARPFGLELLVMYATDERTDKRRDGRTKATLIVPFATGGAIINLLK